MTDPAADLTAALRRDLASIAVPADSARADAMITAATAAAPLDVRSWAAPLAAAAAVVVVGGGAAAIATTHDGGGSPAGGGPVACPAVSSSATVAPATSSATPSPHTSTPAASADPCTAPPGTPNPSAVYPLPPSGTQSPDAGTSSSAPSVAIATAGTSPTYVPSPHPVSLPATFEMIAAADTSMDIAVAVPAGTAVSLYVVQYDRLSGASGTIRTEQGSQTVSVHDIADDRALTYVGTSPYPSSRLVLSCTGGTTCRVRVTISKTAPAGPPVVTATPTR